MRRFLTVLCFSTRPLTVNELIDAHAVDLGESPHLDRGRLYETDDLVDICLGLIEIAATKDDNGQNTLTARIAHFSVQEYLQSDRILQQNSGRFAIRSAPANTEIAQICLVYLLEPILSSGAPGKAKLREFPLAHFAAEYWYHHYASSEEGKLKIEQLLPELFKNDTGPFTTWIRLYDMDRPWWQQQRNIQRPADDISSPLYYAALLGLDSVLNCVIAFYVRDANLPETVNAQGGLYGNALQAASFGGHENAVQTLLDRGANVNAQGGKYGNALQAASFGGYKEVVQMLLDRGADVVRNTTSHNCFFTS